jgi:hypothetical protein
LGGWIEPLEPSWKPAEQAFCSKRWRQTISRDRSKRATLSSKPSQPGGRTRLRIGRSVPLRRRCKLCSGLRSRSTGGDRVTRRQGGNSTVAVRDFNLTYVRYGSIAPDRHDRDARPMSASPPIAVKRWHRSETPLCARSDRMHRSKQDHSYSITSSAMASIWGGMVR